MKRHYTDNGDGKITDEQTGLMWEKLSNDGSIHDKGTSYTWAEAFAKVDALNTATFAGYTDWRLPNLLELESLRNLQNVNPAVSPEFNTNCGPNSAGCTVTTCSCIVPVGYWSSSTYAKNRQDAWSVTFIDGYTYAYSKGGYVYVRAVRDGS